MISVTKSAITKFASVLLDLFFTFSNFNLFNKASPTITSFEISGHERQFSFRASASHKPNSKLLYEWDFGDGSRECCEQMANIHSSATHLYNDSGVYAVVLKVKSDSGEAFIESSVSI